MQLVDMLGSIASTDGPAKETGSMPHRDRVFSRRPAAVLNKIDQGPPHVVQDLAGARGEP